MTTTRSPTPPPRLARAVGGSIFGIDAAGYHAGRIGYPPELYDAIRARCAGQVGSAIEIGPGTGLATREILARLDPARLIAIEADPALAHYLQVTVSDARLTVVASDFHCAPIEAQVDLACSAAAFHWLEPVAAFARLRQLMRPGATLALWWNTYRVAGVGDCFADAVTPLLADIELPPSEGSQGHYSLDVEHHRAAIVGAGFIDFEPVMFRRERTLDTAQVCALYASYSFVRALSPSRRENLLNAIVRLAQEEFGGTVPNVVLSALYIAAAPNA